MRRVTNGFLMVAAMAAMVIFGGCSSISVHYDYDRSADFASYQTFDWMEMSEIPVGDARAAQERNTLLDKRIKSAVNGELAARGFSPNPDAPDLIVAYHIGVQDKIDVTDWGYSYGRPYYGWHGSNIDVYQYQEGTLIIDLIDAATNELVWRGAAQKTLESNPTPERIEKNINAAVSKIFSQYPPK